MANHLKVRKTGQILPARKSYSTSSHIQKQIRANKQLIERNKRVIKRSKEVKES
ncbi:hypothetical protein [Geomicrobium sediminis]|uniref:Transposase n=1 Tax=Geomicrobium sediminis TaxID=1347788 RepID=A0ABS2PH28_9BACL|nr:hypothetical protein [Geomicrobium sediminis]MBM7634251.1 hypothetical protein [Geomicrobium sediminis]